MDKKELFSEIENIDDELISEADEPVKKSNRVKIFASIGALAACVALIAGIALNTAKNNTARIPLSDKSQNVEVRFDDDAVAPKSSQDLVSLTEEELFTKFNTVIFKGKIISLKNISLDFSGEKEYRAIAEIQVEKVYRGELEVGNILSVLVPCTFNDGVSVEDSDTVAQMKVGMTGIFMPMEYDDSSYYETNGARLALKDIADYGFPDGTRYAFLVSDSGIIYDRYSYKTVENATTIDEIESYIINMIG